MSRASVHPAQVTAHWQRWERIGLGIRLAYNPAQPAAIRCWLGLGAKLAHDSGAAERAMLERSLRLLMQTARDEALPWYWRSVCLEHVPRPLARLTTLLKHADPVAASRLHASVEAAHHALVRTEVRRPG